MTAMLAFLAGIVATLAIEGLLVLFVAVRAVVRSRRPATRPDRIFTLDINDDGAWTPPTSRRAVR